MVVAAILNNVLFVDCPGILLFAIEKLKELSCGATLLRGFMVLVLEVSASLAA